MAKKDYSNLTKEQLLDVIEKLEGKKKYGLVWDEERVPEKVVTDCQDKLPVLTEVKDKEITTAKNEPTHILIEGDNYHALSVLNYTHKGKIDLIYIDPPYNTGKADEFMYNDKYVDINDGYRHSKWLSFMNKRLVLAKNLLTDKGVIFLAIDDNEVAQLKLLCCQVFGEENFIAQFIRKNKAGAGHDSGQVAIEFDYMLCFARNKNAVTFEKEILDVENDSKYKLEDKFVDYRGKYYLRDLDYKGSYSESGDYAITTPDKTEIYAGGKFGKPNTWRWSKDKVKWGIENDYIVFKKVKDQWKVYIKQYQFVDNENNICEEVTYQRIKKVISGYKDLKGKKNEGIKGNLKYFKTSFVANKRNKDQLKIDITKRCTEMLCLKEGVFNLIKEKTDYKIFQQNNRYLAVYYDFANASLDELKEEMNALKGEKVLYCFTVDNNGLDKANFGGWKNIRLEPIPQKILDVYKKIFK